MSVEEEYVVRFKYILPIAVHFDKNNKKKYFPFFLIFFIKTFNLLFFTVG